MISASFQLFVAYQNISFIINLHAYFPLFYDLFFPCIKNGELQKTMESNLHIFELHLYCIWSANYSYPIKIEYHLHADSFVHVDNVLHVLKENMRGEGRGQWHALILCFW